MAKTIVFTIVMVKPNEVNYVVKRGKGKSVVIHIYRMQKLPNELDSENPDYQENDKCPTSQPKLWRKANNAAMETSTHCAKTASCIDSDTNPSLFPSMDNSGNHSPNACVSNGLDICKPSVAESQSTDGASMETAESATTQHRPCPTLANWPARVQRRPARFLETVQACRLPNQNSTARACCRLASSDVTVASCRQLEHGARCCMSRTSVARGCLLSTESVVLWCVDDMPRSKIFRREQEFLDSESSETGSGSDMIPGPDVGLPTGSSESPLAWPVAEENDSGHSPRPRPGRG